MCQALILKFSGQPDPEQMLGVCTTEEIIEVLKDHVRSEVREEVCADYENQISQLENELEEEGDWQSTAESWECDAIGLYRAIEKAIELPWTEALPILRQAMEDHGSEID